MDNYIFKKENIQDFTVNPIKVEIGDVTIENGNSFYIVLKGAPIPNNGEPGGHNFPGTGSVYYYDIKIELKKDKAKLDLPYNAKLNAQKVGVTEIQNVALPYVYNTVLIHFPSTITESVINPELSVYIKS
jgi:hypothetical protein